MYQPPLHPELAHLAEFDVGFGDDGSGLAAIRAGIDALLEDVPPRSDVIGDRLMVREDPPLELHSFTPTTERPHPCVLWFHGGGYVMGSPLIDAARMQEWAVELDCVTLSVDYRLAPEHPFPAAHEDARTALEWMLSNADKLGIDRNRVVIGGASAGGGLAAGLAIAARDLGLALAGQLLFYPMLDDRRCTESSQWETAVWSPRHNDFGWRAYLGPLSGGAVPPHAAPARAVDLPGWRPRWSSSGVRTASSTRTWPTRPPSPMPGCPPTCGSWLGHPTGSTSWRPRRRRPASPASWPPPGSRRPSGPEPPLT